MTIPRETSSEDLDAVAGTLRDLPSRKQRRGCDGSVEEFCQGGERRRRSPELHAPLVEQRHDFKGVLFGEVLVRAGNNFQQNIIQRRFRGIVRSQTEISEGE